jgi:hypothetical protein
LPKKISSKVEKDSLFLIGILAAIALGALVALLTPEQEVLLPVTCTSDEHCGGTVEAARFCREGKLYASGQRNTCTNPGEPGNSCATNYEPWLISDSCE